MERAKRDGLHVPAGSFQPCRIASVGWGQSSDPKVPVARIPRRFCHLSVGHSNELWLKKRGDTMPHQLSTATKRVHVYGRLNVVPARGLHVEHDGLRTECEAQHPIVPIIGTNVNHDWSASDRCTRVGECGMNHPGYPTFRTGGLHILCDDCCVRVKLEDNSLILDFEGESAVGIVSHEMCRGIDIRRAVVLRIQEPSKRRGPSHYHLTRSLARRRGLRTVWRCPRDLN